MHLRPNARDSREPLVDREVHLLRVLEVVQERGADGHRVLPFVALRGADLELGDDPEVLAEQRLGRSLQGIGLRSRRGGGLLGVAARNLRMRRWSSLSKDSPPSYTTCLALTRQVALAFTYVAASLRSRGQVRVASCPRP